MRPAPIFLPRMPTASIRKRHCCVSGLNLLICDEVELDISGQLVFGYMG